MEKFEKNRHLALQLIKTFPISKNGQNYLRLKNGRKLFFKVFIHKYGLIEGRKVKYTKVDVIRRIRLIEFFPYILEKYEIQEDVKDLKKTVFLLDTLFYRIVILETKKKKLELLSIFPRT